MSNMPLCFGLTMLSVVTSLTRQTKPDAGTTAQQLKKDGLTDSHYNDEDAATPQISSNGSYPPEKKC